jgi:surface antigen
VGLLAGRGWERSGAAPLTVAGVPPDVAALRHALQALASGEVLAGESSGARYDVVPTASLRLPSGEYCREFESSVATQAGTQRARGFACRGAEGDWDMRAVASIATDAPSGSGGENYQPAAGGGADWAGAQGAHRLTPAEEQALIERGWNQQR